MWNKWNAPYSQIYTHSDRERERERYERTQIASIILLFCFFGHNFLLFTLAYASETGNSSTVVHYLFHCAKMFLRLLSVCCLQNKCAVWVSCRVFAADKWLYICTLLVGVVFSHTRTDRLISLEILNMWMWFIFTHFKDTVQALCVFFFGSTV